MDPVIDKRYFITVQQIIRVVKFILELSGIDTD